MGRYIGRVKVGKVSPRKGAELAIIRLPVKLKEKAGKFAHIWKVDEDTILIRFSESKEADGDVSVYFGVQKSEHADIEERLKLLEEKIERLERGKLSEGKYYIQNGGYQLTSASSLVVGQRLSEPLTRVRIPARASFL